MLAIGFAMIAITCAGAWLWWRNTLFTSHWYLRTIAQSWWIEHLRACRMGRYREWTPAVDHLRNNAHGRCVIIGAGCCYRCDVGAFRGSTGSCSPSASITSTVLSQGPRKPARRTTEFNPPLAAATLRPQYLAGDWNQLPLIWAGIIGTAVAMYVILDGFDLGISTLSALARNIPNAV